MFPFAEFALAVNGRPGKLGLACGGNMEELFVRYKFPPMMALLSVIRAALFGVVDCEKGLGCISSE